MYIHTYIYLEHQLVDKIDVRWIVARFSIDHKLSDKKRRLDPSA